MEIIIFLFFVALLVGVLISVYEWRKKKTLLAHDLNLRAEEDHHSLAARVHAEDVTFHRHGGFDS